METMPRPRPPYLSREVTRHGKPVWYVRRDGKRIRLRADFGTPEFDAEYQAACNGIRPQKSEEVAGTLGWLIARYRETDAWQRLSLATRQRRESIIKQVLATSGDKPISRITSPTKLIAAIAIAKKPTRPLSSELRVHIAGYFRNRAPQTGFFDPDTRFALRIVDDPPSKSRREESHRSRRRPHYG